MWEYALEVLRDNLWQFVFGLAGILVAVLIHFAGLKRKELLFFSVWAWGEPVDENGPRFKTRRFVVMLANTGKVPIAPSDYEGPITFYAPKPCQILDAAITATHPDNIHPRMVLDQGKLELSPLLLNPGDSITFKASSTVAPFINSICVDGRIAGVNEIERAAGPLTQLFSVAGSLLLIWTGLYPPSEIGEIRFYLVAAGVVMAITVLWGPWPTRVNWVYLRESVRSTWDRLAALLWQQAILLGLEYRKKRTRKR